MPEIFDITIGEIVLRDYRKAKIFKGMGIDFSCGGNMTISEACMDNGLSTEEVIRQLAAELPPTVVPEMDFQNWDIGFLCKYLVQLHHQYIKNKTSFIGELAGRVGKANDEKHPEIAKIAEIFEKAGKLLTMNMHKEEQVLFPYITELNEANKKGRIIPQATSKPVFMQAYLMRAEHEKVVEDFRLIRQLTNNYQLPPYAMYGYGILFKMLQEYEDDLHLHLHMENNILFPKAIKMESEMRSE